MASVSANKGASKSVADLQQRVPNATEEECQRFHESFSDESTERLTAYMDWRQEHELNSDETTTDTSDDARNWQKATDLAIARARKDSDAKEEAPTTLNKEHQKHCRASRFRHSSKEGRTVFHARDNDLARPIFNHAIAGNPLCDRKGNKIFQILAARVDLRAACANTYATAFCLYLDSHLRRDSLDLVTLLIDVRPGAGWPNLPAMQMLGFIRCLAQVLYDSYPGRLHQCILFPVPRPAILIWKTVQNFLDPLVRKSVVLVSGPAGRTSPVPRDRLKEYFDDQVGLDLMEQTRLEAFYKKE